MRKICLLLLLFMAKLSLAQQLTSSNLPILVITMNNNLPIVDEPKRIGHLGIIWNGDGQENQITDPFNDYDGQIGIEIRGSSSQGFPQKNYAVETQKADSTSDNVSIFGFPKENDWVLHGPYTDKTLMRNALAYIYASWIMPYAPRVKFCELVINGDYQGVYMFTEKIKRDDNRVDISKLEPQDISGDALTGGYILKFDKFDGAVSYGFPSAYASTPGGAPGGTTYQYHYPKADEITYEQKVYIQNYISNFENLMASPGFNDLVSGYTSMLDVPSVLQMIFIQEISRNVDGYRLSTFMYKDRNSIDSRLHLGPVWDFNLGFSNVDYCIGPSFQGWAIDFNDFCPGDFWVVHFWWRKLWNDPAFRQQMRDEWVALRADKFSTENMLYVVDSLETLLQGPAQRHFTKWPILNQYVWPNPAVLGSYHAEVQRMRSWLESRLIWMDGAMEELVKVDTTVTHIDPPGNELPIAVPSLFHDKTEVYFAATAYKRVYFDVFDAQGRQVLHRKEFYTKSGVTIIEVDGSDWPPGMYFYRLINGKSPPNVGRMMKY